MSCVQLLITPGPEKRAGRIVETLIAPSVLLRCIEHDPKCSCSQARPVIVSLIESYPEAVCDISQRLAGKLAISLRQGHA